MPEPTVVQIFCFIRITSAGNKDLQFFIRQLINICLQRRRNRTQIPSCISTAVFLIPKSRFHDLTTVIEYFLLKILIFPELNLSVGKSYLSDQKEETVPFIISSLHFPFLLYFCIFR